MKGKRLASNRKIRPRNWSGSQKAWNWYSDTIDAKFNKVWRSKGLPGHLTPYYMLEPIQIFKTDRTGKWFPMSDP